MSKLKLRQAEIDNMAHVPSYEVQPDVCGIGYMDVGFKRVTKDGANCWQFDMWYSLIYRVSTHDSSLVCQEWLSFSNFLEWVNKEVDYSGKPIGYRLSKDCIDRNNNVYCPQFCSLVPEDVYGLLIRKPPSSFGYPIGVSKPSNGNYLATIRIDKKLKRLGTFDTPEEAFLAYKTAKESHIKAVANQYEHVLKPAVYESLMKWEIEP